MYDWVVEKPQEQDDRLPPPRTLILDFTLTHTCFGRSQVHSTGQLTHTRYSDGFPDPDGDPRVVVRKKILICHLGLIYHYRVSFVLGVVQHF